jgi:hypothetical protein
MTSTRNDGKSTMSQAELERQFRDDYATVKKNIHCALASLAAESDLSDALEVLKKMRLARFAAARALKRILESRSYRVQFKKWDDFCKDLDIYPRTAYFLVSDVAIFDSCSAEIEKLAGHLSNSKLRALGKLTPEQRNTFVEAAASEIEPAAVQGKFRELMAALAANPKSAPTDEFPKQRIQKVENGIAWMRRTITNQALWFEARGFAAKAQGYLDGLLNVALEAEKR